MLNGQQFRSVTDLASIADPNVPLDKLASQDAGYIERMPAHLLDDPVVVSRGMSGREYIYDGHHRIVRAQQLGVDQLPWRYTDDENEPMHGVAARRH